MGASRCRRHYFIAQDAFAAIQRNLAMSEYLEWLTSGLILLWILSAHEAHATAVDPGARCQPPSISISLRRADVFAGQTAVAPAGTRSGARHGAP